MLVINERRIDAPVARVWELLTGDFGDISRWAGAVSASSFVRDRPETLVGGTRSCTIVGLGELREHVTECDPSTLRLSYDISGMPFPVRVASNDWQIRSCPEWTVVTSHMEFALTPIVGALMAPILRRQMRKAVDRLLEEMAYFVETGTVHPRKTTSRLVEQPAASRA